MFECSMTRNAPTVLGLLTLCIAYTLFRAATDIPRLISPQGCRMSWMSPSYILQSEFNPSWTPLASRYSLWLYREVGWEPDQAMGLPVLFIPGSAGSSHQVRSIASSAARQYFSSPFVVSHEFSGRGAKPVDFYTVEFNEDHTAFHGPTVDSQIAYTSAAVEYILSRYPPDTQIIVMGYSMGGCVGTALLPSGRVMTLITMSTPHTLPPVRLDARMEEIYSQNRDILREDETPILSICGGATDMTISSESCILPEGSGVYRRTVFTSALEGAWTGVGHLEIVWCHQVRWRVARAALELGIAKTADVRVRVLDRWLRDGSLLPPDGDSARDLTLHEGEYEVLSEDMQLVLDRLLGKRTYLLPVPSTGDSWTFVLYVSRGSILNMSPHHALDLRVSVHLCMEDSMGAAVSCNPLAPASLKLLPAPISGKPFPIPDEGTDESEGIVFFEAELPRGAEGWVGVTIDTVDHGGGWVAGGFNQPRNIKSELGIWDLSFGGAKISVPRSDNERWKTYVSLPRLPATTLLVYRLVPKIEIYPPCAAPLFSPLLVYTSEASELHYYRLDSGQPIFLHTHSSAPYIPLLRPASSHGLNLTIHFSGSSCQDVTEMLLSVDWWASLGRTATRYPITLLSWSVGIASLLLFHFSSIDGQQLSVRESLRVFVRRRMPVLMAVAGVTGLLPLGPNYYLGIGDELGMLRGAFAAFLVGLATGMVCVSWWLLEVLMWPLRLLGVGFIQRQHETTAMRRSRIIYMVMMLVLIALWMPWQVAFLGCWISQLLNCIATSRRKSYPGSAPTLTSSPTNSTPVCSHGEESPVDCSTPSSNRLPDTPNQTLDLRFANRYNENTHVLLFMTWLLLLTIPTLVVWVRTMQTAGYTTPFNGDHNVFKVAPMLMLVENLRRGRPLDKTTMWRFSARWGWVVVAAVAFLMGGRWAYEVYEKACIQVLILLVFQLTV